LNEEFQKIPPQGGLTSIFTGSRDGRKNSMKISVLAKLVPDTETTPRISGDGSDIVHEGIKMVINPYDEFAVEEAVKLSEEKGAAAMVITMGAKDSEEALRTALAMGIPEASRIEDPGGEEDCFKTALILSKALEGEKPDIILCGRQAFDDDASSVGPLVAEFLKIPFVSNAVKIEVLDGGRLTVHRDREGGKDVVEVSAPCVISCQKGLNKPRYPKLMGLMKARKKDIPVRTAGEMGFSTGSLNELVKTQVLKLYHPPSRPPGKKLSGDPALMAREPAAAGGRK
jgi:electron transfer flavoprotein beta subunit